MPQTQAQVNLPTEQVIQKLVEDFNLTHLMISPARDALIMCPSPKWIAAFAAWIFQHRPVWVAEAQDCDDIARWAQVCASEARVAMGGQPSGNSVFVATVSGVPGKRLNGILFSAQYYVHDTLLILDCQSTWWFVEPQTGEFCHASQSIVSKNSGGPVAGVDCVSL